MLIALLIKRFDGNALFTIPIKLSPIGYRLITTGQTDAIVLAGVLLPAGFDLLFFGKPQVTAHVFWVKGLARPKIYLVSGIALLLFSWLIWDFWLKEVWQFGQTKLIGGWWNFSLCPYCIPIGLLMVYLSLKKKDVGFGIIASPLLFPTALVHKSKSRRNPFDGSEKLCHFVTLGHTQTRHFVKSGTAN